MMTMTEPNITSRFGVLNVKVVVPTTSIFVIICIFGYSHTKSLVFSTLLNNNLVNKNAKFLGSFVEEEYDFVATFGVNSTQI